MTCDCQTCKDLHMLQEKLDKDVYSAMMCSNYQRAAELLVEILEKLKEM